MFVTGLLLKLAVVFDKWIGGTIYSIGAVRVHCCYCKLIFYKLMLFFW